VGRLNQKRNNEKHLQASVSKLHKQNLVWERERGVGGGTRLITSGSNLQRALQEQKDTGGDQVCMGRGDGNEDKKIGVKREIYVSSGI